MLQPEVLAILCCPDDGSALAPANDALVAEINNVIRRCQLHNRAGRLVKQMLDAGLTNSAGDLVYPIMDGIPILVREEAIPLDQLARKADGSRPTSPNS